MIDKRIEQVKEMLEELRILYKKTRSVLERERITTRARQLNHELSILEEVVRRRKAKEE